ncbi:FtsK/SpoIIIE domain-containing protein [Blastococcus sp. CT_GayMR19]|uniref:FtsK/SpoIIIE domain-containing protein n=1 Tax=Blastococcus sp. CT_GayMR19 TaxID=2559608 RepID=UPI0014307ED9|nr:FtsK/SpoIIIE domain-containing protein [Blastococcus sp. CT_GayMR19]
MIRLSTSEPTAARSTRRWTVVVVGGAVDLEVTAAEDATLGTVLPCLGRELGSEIPGLWAGSTRLDDDVPLTAAELAHGAVLGLGRPVPRVVAGRGASALSLHVVGGPDAGRTLALGQGRHVLGRGGEATIRLDDPDVSRRHVEVHVGGGEITVADLSSTNGSRLDDRDLDERPVSWPAGAVLRFGASAVSVAGPGGAGAALTPAAGGRVRLRPARRMSTPRPEVEVTFPRPPEPPPRRRLAWVAVALPAVAGVLMAWLLHTPTFLFFALLSPVVALGTWLSDRWSGRQSGRKDAAAHALELLDAQNRLADAVRSCVRAADVAHPDLATLAGAARRRSSLLWSRSRGDADALTIRVGTGPGTIGVTRIEPDGARRPESAPHVPAVVDLRAAGGLAVIGPRERTVGVLHGVLAQLTALHPPGEVDLLLLTDTDRLRDWEWARWLPHLDTGAVHVRHTGASGTEAQQEDEALHAWLTGITARRRAAAGPSGRHATPLGWLVVVVDRPLDARLAAALRGAVDAGILTLAVADSVADLPVTVDAALRLSGETGDVGVLSRQAVADQSSIVVDRLPRSVAAQFARDLAALSPVTSDKSLPRRVRLLDLPVAGLRLCEDGAATGSWSRSRDRLVATLGRTAEGPVEIDLCRQGPHALVAGTTGSGKSELLQTLIAGLALNHPPDRCSFLLVDYKGGAAFAEAAALPHTVGLVTDLDGQTTARALRSLGAELTRREAILATHQVSDIAALPDEVDLARLVIVVDEFATLADELPSFVPGLVSIAQRGRSLGVHLVLATQRPGGVVSPEIRANCTLRICLRTTDETDSRDVLGTTDAAHLPVDLPGRAYLRVGSGAPVALQVARVASSASRVPDPGPGPEIRRWAWPYRAEAPPDPAASGQETDLALLCRAVARRTGTDGVPTPHRPWRPPLAERIPAESLDGPADRNPGASDVDDASPRGARRSTRLRIGLVDRPDGQTQEPLELDLADGGTWLAVGGPRSGRTTLLRSVLSESVRRLGPADLHVHVLEAGAGALGTEAAALPHTGTTVGGEDVLRAVRLVDRLAQEVAARRAAATPGAGWPLILLLVDGAESICTVLDDADPGRGSAHLLRLARDGAAVGLTCILTADRAVPGGRLAAVAGRRLVLPLPDRADYAVAGVPARAVPGHRPPGRALLGEEALECQLALPRPPEPRAADQWFPLPLRIADLPSDPLLDVPHDLRSGVLPAPGTAGSLPLPIGPGGDTGDVLEVDLLRTGGLLVTGPPGSGRSTALDAFSAHLQAVGVAVLRLGAAPAGTPVEADLVWLDPGDGTGMAAWVAELDGRPGVVVADDVGTPAEFPALGRLPALGSRGGIALLAAAAPGHLSGHYQGPIASLRRGRSGLLLCPGPGDAELLAIRLPRTPLPVRPGSGWLVTGVGMERVQVARRRAPVPVAVGSR